MTGYFVLALLSMSLALAFTPLVLRLALWFGAVDRPGARKIHQIPKPRLGGVAIVLSCLLTVLLAMAVNAAAGEIFPLDLERWVPILCGGAIIFAVGVWDDVRPIPAGVKFFFQGVAAGVVIVSGFRIDQISLLGENSLQLGLFSVPLTFLWIVGITNAFNLIDGLDGLAAGLASIAAGTCAGLFFLLGNYQDAALLMILLGALLGFLRYNFNPARIFLGDSGSLFIGYVLGVVTITDLQRSATTLAVVIPLLVFGLPIIDTLLSMVRRFVGSLSILQSIKAPLKERILCAKRIFEADQGHIHHRLIAIGFSHRNAVLFLYSLSLVLSIMALLSVLARYPNPGIILVAVGLATYIGLRKLGYKEVAFLKSGTLLRWSEQLPFNRLFFLGFVDLLLITAAYWLAYILKYSPAPAAGLGPWHLNAFPAILIIQQIAFYVLGLYRGVWRAAGMGDMIRAAVTAGVAVFLSYALSVVYAPPAGVLAFFSIDFLLLGVLVVGARSSYRVLDYFRQREDQSGGPAIIYGAGNEGQAVVREFLQNSKHGLRPIGFLDDDPRLQGREVNRLPILGCGDDLQNIFSRKPVSAVIVSSSEIEETRLRGVLEFCQARGIKAMKVQMSLVPVENRVNGDSDLDARTVMAEQPREQTKCTF